MLSKFYLVYVTTPGEGIGQAAQNMRDLAYIHKVRCEADFNGVKLAAYPDSLVSAIVAQYEQGVRSGKS